MVRQITLAAPGSTPVADVYDGIFNPIAIEIAWFSGTSSGFTETSSYTVPAGKRLEITEISCEAYAPGSTAVMIKLTATSGGARVTHYITGFAASRYFYRLLDIVHDQSSFICGSRDNRDCGCGNLRQTPPGATHRLLLGRGHGWTPDQSLSLFKNHEGSCGCNYFTAGIATISQGLAPVGSFTRTTSLPKARSIMETSSDGPLAVKRKLCRRVKGQGREDLCPP